MLPEFHYLSSSQQELLLKAPILTCILIAGADGEIRKAEVNQAVTTASKKLNTTRGELARFYQFVVEDFEDKVKIILQNYPRNHELRNKAIVHELSELNNVFPLLPIGFATAFYSSLRELALHIAQSSGGILGLNAVNAEEEQYVNLPMIKDPTPH